MAHGNTPILLTVKSLSLVIRQCHQTDIEPTIHKKHPQNLKKARLIIILHICRLDNNPYLCRVDRKNIKNK